MRLLALGLLVAAILAACGDSESGRGDSSASEATSTSAEATSAEFVRRVDALCKSVSPRLTQIQARIIRARDAARAGRASLPKTFETFAALLRQASTIAGRFETSLRQMEAPRSERRFRGALLRSVEQSSSNLQQQVRAAERQDAVELRDLSRQGTVITARNKGLVTGHGGFRFCGRG